MIILSPGLKGGPGDRPFNCIFRKNKKNRNKTNLKQPEKCQNQRRSSKCWPKVCLLFLTFFRSLLQLLSLFEYTLHSNLALSWQVRIKYHKKRILLSMYITYLSMYLICYKTEMFVITKIHSSFFLNKWERYLCIK